LSPSGQEGDLTEALRAAVLAAVEARRPISIRGSGSKAFLGPAGEGEPLAVAGHRGILHYDPSELVITARAATPLAEIEAALSAERQMLAFEPPHFGPGATLGGTLACNLSGPRRPYVGAARDFVLGARILNGRGEVLRFGGEVMKNVAGYDLSRLMAGAFGTLGVLLDLSLKVLPRPEMETTLYQDADAATALERFHAWARLPLPISAAAHQGERLYLRLSGTAAGIASARERIGGEVLEQGADFWLALREQQLAFFVDPRPLWRLSLPSAAELVAPEGEHLIDWGGAQRWLKTQAEPAAVRSLAMRLGGHASLYSGWPGEVQRFHPLAPGLARLHQRIKASLDPLRLLNPGRLTAEL
jgi:glycolate oxidase FAD binding subunit